MKNLSVKKPEKCLDNSIYLPEYAITKNGDPICLSEYASQIVAETDLSHVILIEDFSTGMGPLLKETHINVNAIFDELILRKHPERSRLQYAFNAKFEKLY